MLLDALTYVIDGDNSKLDKSIDGSEKKVGEFGKSMSDAEKKAQGMESKVKGAFLRIGGALLAAVAVGKVLANVSAYAATTDAIRTVSENLGIAIEDVDAFGKSVESLGGDAAAARESMSQLSEKIGDGLRDAAGAGAKRFSELGISLKDTSGKAKDTMTVMGELSDAVSGLSRQEAQFRLADLGVRDEKTIALLLKGRQELERVMRTQKENGVVTKEAAERAQKFTLAQARLGIGTQNVMDMLSDVALPVLTKLLNGFSAISEWMTRNGYFVKGVLIAIASALTVFFLPAVISAAGALWLLVAPFLAIAIPIAALIGLFALLYDDIMNFIDGNDSLIGQILTSYPIIGEKIKEFGDKVSEVWDMLKEVFAMGLVAGQQLSDGLVAIFDAMANSIKGTFNGMIDFIKDAWSFISGIYDKVMGLASTVGGFVGGLVGTNSMPAAKEQMATASASPMNAVTSNTISNASNSKSETNVSVGQVTVQTQSTDAKGISKDIGGELSGQLKNLQTESASGVAR